MSQQILIGFVDQLEINEPEDLHEKDERDLGKGERECTYMYVLYITSMSLKIQVL